MKTTLLSPFAQYLVFGMLIFSLLVSPFSARAQTTLQDLTDQLDALAASLLTVGAAVRASTTLTEPERLVLMTQLITVSTEILNLRKALAAYYPVTVPVVEVTAEDVGLYRIIVKYNPVSSVATTTLYYDSYATTTMVYNLPTLLSVAGFDGKMRSLRTEVTNLLFADTGVRTYDLDDLMFVSARNPIRDIGSIAPNSTTAQNLAGKIGVHSIVDSVTVYPGYNTGSIVIGTDQDESVVLNLTYDTDDNNYDYRAEAFITTPYDAFYSFFWDDEGYDEATPIASDGAYNATEADIESYIVDLFDTVPFTSEIPNFPDKLRQFLVRSTTYTETNSSGYWSGRDCFDDPDKVVVNEFVRYVLDGFGAQYYDVDNITNYISQVEYDEDHFYSSRCRGVRTYF